MVVGHGRDAEYFAELRELADKLGIADRITWVGGVLLEDTVDFYRAADVFVYPSFNETFGLPILEAMACACPVVTSSVSAMPRRQVAPLCWPTPAIPRPSPPRW